MTRPNLANPARITSIKRKGRLYLATCPACAVIVSRWAGKVPTIRHQGRHMLDLGHCGACGQSLMARALGGQPVKSGEAPHA